MTYQVSFRALTSSHVKITCYFTHAHENNISYFQKWKEWYHNCYGYIIPWKVLSCVPAWSKHPRFFLVNLRHLRNFWKCLETIVWPSDNFWRIFENLRKVFGNLRKIVKEVVIAMLYLTREIPSWTLKEKFHIYAQPCIIFYFTGIAWRNAV